MNAFLFGPAAAVQPDPAIDPTTLVVRPIDWPVLARLAADRQPTLTSVTTPVTAGVPAGSIGFSSVQRSGGHLREHVAVHREHREQPRVHGEHHVVVRSVHGRLCAGSGATA